MADIASAADPNIYRNVIKQGFPDPFTFKFPEDVPKEQQDAQIQQHYAQLQGGRDLSTLGPQGALGRLLVSAQQALTPKPVEEEGPRVIRGATAWGLTPQQVTSTFDSLSDRQYQQQSMEMQKQENLARRQQALAEMQQQMDLAGEEQKFNLKLKGMEHTQKLDEKAKEHELNAQLEQQKAKAREDLEVTKAKNKTPKLEKVKNADGSETWAIPVLGGQASAAPQKSEQDLTKDAVNIAQDWVENHVMFNKATGEDEPMTWETAWMAANELTRGRPVHVDGYEVRRRADADLVPITDETGTTKLGKKGEGVTTKVPVEPKRSEVTSEYSMAYEIAKDSLKEAQTALSNMPQSPDDDGYDAAKLNKVKVSVETAQAEVEKSRKQLQSHLKKEDAVEPVESGSVPEATTVASKEEAMALPEGALFIYGGKTYKKVGTGAEPQ